MSAAYKVTAPLVQALVDREKGIYVHVYADGILPSNVDKTQLDQLLETGMVKQVDAATADTDEEPEGYGAMTVAGLKAEINDRNASRDETDQIVPDGSKKADLVAALQADDDNA